MYFFKRMIDAARLGHIRNSSSPYSSDSFTLQEKLFWLAEHCESFVFSGVSEKQLDIYDLDPDESPQEELDLPFPVTSLELDGAALSIPWGDGVNVSDILCILVHEIAPKVYEYFVLIGQQGRGQAATYINETSGPIYSIVTRQVRDYLYRLQTEEDGVAATKERIKLGSGTKKRTHVIKRVIYVRPRKSTRSIGYSRIDWTHRVSVRGHWRVLVDGRVGKNREDEYCVPGYTWVRAHIKGPEDKPLLKKARVVV